MKVLKKISLVFIIFFIFNIYNVYAEDLPQKFDLRDYIKIDVRYLDYPTSIHCFILNQS